MTGGGLWKCQEGRGQAGTYGEFPRLSCTAECVKSTGMDYSCAGRYDTVQAAVVRLKSAAVHGEETEHFSWVMQ